MKLLLLLLPFFPTVLKKLLGPSVVFLYLAQMSNAAVLDECTSLCLTPLG